MPLLSICISTYNASSLLRVVLEAVLPQSDAAGGEVEVLVVDDRSTDETGKVVGCFSPSPSLRYIRNESNLGSSANLVNGPVNHATGEYVWCWNQHCLIYPGALRRLLEVLRGKEHLDVFYLNFRCAAFPQQWPSSADGGYDGEFDYVSRQDVNDRDVDRWHELLEASNSVGTQSYAHVVRRGVWTSYWKARTVGKSYRSAISTYPHTCMLAETVFHKPSYYVGTPMLTIFNGAQSWSDLNSRARVYLIGFPGMLSVYRKVGWEGPQLEAAGKWATKLAGSVAETAFRERRADIINQLLQYLLSYGNTPGAIAAVWRAFLRSRCCLAARILGGMGSASVNCRKRFRQWSSYLFHRCRPARWIRTRVHHAK